MSRLEDGREKWCCLVLHSWRNLLTIPAPPVHPCHLGGTAGAVVSTEQGCPNVYHTEATLMEWLGLVWARVQNSLRWLAS